MKIITLKNSLKEIGKTDHLIQLIIKIDKIHKENGGKVTLDELKLRIELQVNINFEWVKVIILKILNKIRRIFIKK